MNKLELLYLKESYKIDALELSMMKESLMDPTGFIESSKAFIKEIFRKLKIFINQIIEKIKSGLNLEVRSRILLAKLKNSAAIANKMVKMNNKSGYIDSTRTIELCDLSVGASFKTFSSEMINISMFMSKVNMEGSFGKLTHEKVERYKKVLENKRADLEIAVRDMENRKTAVRMDNLAFFIEDSVRKSQEYYVANKKYIEGMESEIRKLEKATNSFQMELNIISSKIISEVCQTSMLKHFELMDKNFKTIEEYIKTNMN